MSIELSSPLIIQDESNVVQKPIYLKTNIVSKIFLWWCNKLISKGNKTSFQQNMHWDLRSDEENLTNFKNLYQNWLRHKNKSAAIFRALWSTYYKITIFCFVLAIILGALQFTAPLLIYEIINYIESNNQDLQLGIILVLCVGLSRLFIALISVQDGFLFSLIGIRTTNSVNAMIYYKSLNFSLISSSEHSVGSLVNHMQVDSQKLNYLSQILAGVIIFPLQLLAGIYIMYYMVGIAFLPGFGVVVFMSSINYVLGKLFYKFQKQAMEKKDNRMKIANEIFNGIKYIKMSGWEEHFLDKALKARDLELGFLRKQFTIISFNIFSLWLTPMLVTTSVFGYLAFTGQPLTAQEAFTVLSTFMVLQEPLRSLPRFVTLILESVVALKRIDKFLKAEEINTDYIIYNPSIYQDPMSQLIQPNAIIIKNGTFYWSKLDNKPATLPKNLDSKQDKEQPKAIKDNTRTSENKTSMQESILESTIDNNINNSSTKSSLIPIHYENLNEFESTIGQPILKNINLEIKKGSFTAIIGDVASGKSSLLYALIGEMTYNKTNPPRIILNGSISYVSQKPWILNDTVKNNIIFGHGYDEEAYHLAIKYSCLEQDLKILTKHDLTEIGIHSLAVLDSNKLYSILLLSGEKGVNLSGGQKSRISLARAIYSNKDIYLLDDPLSAVDAHVGTFIVHHCFLNYLKEKTRILVTHNLDCLKFTDNVIIMDKGIIVAQGPFDYIEKLSIFREILEKEKKKQHDSEKDGDLDPQNEGEKKNDELNDSQNGPFIIDSEEKVDKFLAQKVSNEPDNKILDGIDMIDSGLSNKIISKNEVPEKMRHDLPTPTVITFNYKEQSEHQQTKQNKVEMELCETSEFKSSENSLIKTESKEISKIKVSPEGSSKEEGKDKAESDEPLMIEEDRAYGIVSWQVYKSYVRYYGGLIIFLIVQLVMICWISLQTASNFWLSYWSNADQQSDESYYIKYYALFALSYGLFSFIRVSILFKKSVDCSKQIHKNMMHSVIRAPINTFFDRVPIGRILNRISKDLNVLDNYIALSFGSLLVCFYSLLSDLVVCIYVGSLWVLPAAGIFFILAFWIQKLYMGLNREVVRLESISKSPIISFFSETLNGLASVRGYKEQDKFFQKHIKNQNENTKNQLLTSALSNWFTLYVTISSLFIVLPVTGICVVLRNQLAIEMNPGLAGLLITYVLSIDDDIISFLWMVSDFESKLISLERCNGFVKIQPEANTRVLNPAAIKGYSAEHWPTRGVIEFKNYSVKYRKNLPMVLKNISFKINSHEKIGLVGRTGSGKSTIFLSILRILEPEYGSILIDNVDISTLGLYDLRQKITIIPQDPMLFKGTIRENIDVLNEFTDEEIWKALDMVCLKSKFQTDNGLDFEIKDEGENLSAGEKQLICIGRAILKKNKIILIDEATSNIDIKTEKIIIEIIKENLKDYTVLTIAHRLKTIMHSDRVLVMDHGKIAEFDTPDNLLNNDKSMFYSLHQEAMKILHKKDKEPNIV